MFCVLVRLSNEAKVILNTLAVEKSEGQTELRIVNVWNKATKVIDNNFL